MKHVMNGAGMGYHISEVFYRNIGRNSNTDSAETHGDLLNINHIKPGQA